MTSLAKTRKDFNVAFFSLKFQSFSMLAHRQLSKTGKHRKVNLHQGASKIAHHLLILTLKKNFDGKRVGFIITFWCDKFKRISTSFQNLFVVVVAYKRM